MYLSKHGRGGSRTKWSGGGEHRKIVERSKNMGEKPELFLRL